MKKVIIAILIAATAIAFATWYFFYKKDYEIIHPSRGPIHETVYGLGKVKSHERYEVIVGVISNVTKLYVDEGDEVKKGDLIIKLENGGPFVAPFNGTITMVSVRTGEIAVPQRPLVRLEDLNDTYLELSLEQESALRVRKGQPAKISFESIRNKVLIGKVSSVFSREDEFLVHVQVEGLDPGVLPGMTADVSIEIGKISDALLVPAKAVTNGFVTVRRKHKWVKEQVEAGHMNNQSIEILSKNLTTNDELRVTGGE